MLKYEVVFYEKNNGDCPIEKFIKSLDIKIQAKLVGLLELLEEKGTSLREPYSKYVGDGIFELRCKLGNNIVRVLFFYCSNGKIFLTNGFIKKTQRTPMRELKLSKERMKDYNSRMEQSYENITTI